MLFNRIQLYLHVVSTYVSAKLASGALTSCLDKLYVLGRSSASRGCLLQQQEGHEGTFISV
jgi:hypothetical protein